MVFGEILVRALIYRNRCFCHVTRAYLLLGESHDERWEGAIQGPIILVLEQVFHLSHQSVSDYCSTGHRNYTAW